MMRRGFLKKIITTFVSFTMMATMLAPASMTFAADSSVAKGAYGAGVGKQWPDKVNAPYADLGAWVTTPGFYVGSGGTLSLKKIYEDTGVKYFNVAFIQAAGSQGGSGKLSWGWAGYPILSEGTNDQQYNNIKQTIKDIRDVGGDVCISFGGAGGTAFWQASQDVDTLYNTYLDIVNGYGLTRMDLDVEGGGMSKQQNEANAKAVKKLQEKTGVEVSLTLPVLPDGLDANGCNVLQAYVENGVNLRCINIMAMCYGSGVIKPGENYGTASVSAMAGLQSQIKSYYSKYANKTLSDQEAWQKVGVTVSCGNEPGNPAFPPEYSQLVLNSAKEHNINMVSMWSINKDAQVASNHGVTNRYEHTNIYKTFEDGSTIGGGDKNTAPVISGVSDKKVELGQAFNALDGVKATDNEDGDLTKSIVVNGIVDTSKEGVYTITYSVTDSKGLTTTATAKITVAKSGTVVSPDKGSYGVGVSTTVWPKKLVAPYVDMGEYTTKSGYFFGYDDGGTTNLRRLAEDTGVKYYNLGFIQSCSAISNGKLSWGWAGLSSLSEGSNHEQYIGLKKSITELRSIGGDVIVSFGGAGGTAFWQSTQDVDVLANTYIDIVNGYGLSRIDLDVEGAAQNKEQNIANAKAIKKLQDATGVQVTLTVPVNPDGLTTEGLNVLEAYVENGVDLSLVNIMAMCYGELSLNYGTASVEAMDCLKNQIKQMYSKYGVTLSDQAAYARVGVTVSVGYESNSDPIFTTDWSQIVYDAAVKNNIGMLSFWSMNRDAQLKSNTGIKSAYEHTNVFKKYQSTSTENTKPIISGAVNKEVAKGSTFNPMDGVTAWDNEDGDLTKSIVVEGTVDTSKTGSYNVKYTVKDSKGLTTTVQIVITVVEKVKPDYPEYNSETVYEKGDKVIYNGSVWEAQWYTVNETPGADQWGPWKKVEEITVDPVDPVITLAMLAERYNMQSGDAGWDDKYDVYKDGIIDISDLVYVASRL